MKRTSPLPLILLLIPLLLGTAAMAQASEGAPAEDLLRQSLSIHRNGRHNHLLTGLRRLRDPDLQPLFAYLATSTLAPLEAHGILGLAELKPKRGINLEQVAQIDDAQIQGQVITLAMDQDLLSQDNAQQLISWQDLDAAVKLLIVTRLIEAGTFNDKAILDQLAEATHLGHRCFAALLLTELGDPAGTEGLQELERMTDPRRNGIREALLRTALAHRFVSASSWAFAVSTDADAPNPLSLLALRVAIGLGHSDAVDLWRQRYESTADTAERIRLARTALTVSPWLKDDLFDLPSASEDELIAQIGRTGQAIVAGSPRDIAEQLVALVQQNHPLSNRWVLWYAREHVQPADAQSILLALIQAAEDGAPQDKALRLQFTVEATEAIYDLNPQTAAGLLRPILADNTTDPRQIEAILLGLVSSKTTGTNQVIENLPAFGTLDANNLTLLIRSNNDAALNENELKDLQRLVRDPALDDGLNVRAAWSYLKYTNRSRAVLKSVLKSQGE